MMCLTRGKKLVNLALECTNSQEKVNVATVNPRTHDLETTKYLSPKLPITEGIGIQDNDNRVVNFALECANNEDKLNVATVNERIHSSEVFPKLPITKSICIQDNDNSVDEDCSSGSEFVPSDSVVSESDYSNEDSSNSSNTFNIAGYEFNTQPKRKVVSSNMVTSTITTAVLSTPPSITCSTLTAAVTSTTCEFEKSSDDSNIDHEGVFIRSAKKSVMHKRIRDKRHCCQICQSILCNLPRHLQTKHASDVSVARILALRKNSKERRKEFGKLQRIGDFYHNCEVLKFRKGELILLRCPTKYEKQKYSYSNYGPCPDCLGFMLKKHIGVHIKYKCPEKINSENRKPISESNGILSGILYSGLDEEFMEHIINKMVNDIVSQICKGDNLILKFGNMYFEKFGATQSELTRQSMRQLGRLMLEIKNKHSILNTLSECLSPQYFDVIIEATQTICCMTQKFTSRPEFKTPFLGLKIGHHIKKCAAIKRGIALRKGNVLKSRELKAFVCLLESEWSIKISSNALNTLHKRKFNCTQLLPLTSDLIKLNSYLDSQITLYKMEMEKPNVSVRTWHMFASLILCRIVCLIKEDLEKLLKC